MGREKQWTSQQGAELATPERVGGGGREGGGEGGGGRRGEGEGGGREREEDPKIQLPYNTQRNAHPQYNPNHIII